MLDGTPPVPWLRPYERLHIDGLRPMLFVHTNAILPPVMRKPSAADSGCHPEKLEASVGTRGDGCVKKPRSL